MSIAKTLLRVGVLLFAVYAGLYLVPAMVVLDRDDGEWRDEYVVQRMPQVEQLLNDTLAREGGVCIAEGYTFNSSTYRAAGPFVVGDDSRVFRPRCNRCDDLAEAGLLRKTVVDALAESGRVATRFELTDLGKTFYSEEISTEHGGVAKWRFCFAKTVIHEIPRAVRSPFGNGIDVVYVPKVIDVHPFLFDPKARPLRLGVPDEQPVMLPPRDANLYFPPDKAPSVSAIVPVVTFEQ